MSKSFYKSREAWALLAVLVVSFALSFGHFTSVRARTVRAPYLIDTEIQYFGNDGKLAGRTFLREAVRGDGSFVTEFRQESDPSGVSSTREVYLVSEKLVAIIDPAAEIRSSRTISDEGVRMRTRTIGDCLSAYPGPSGPFEKQTCSDEGESRLGMRVHRLVKISTDSDGATRKWEALVAPELDWKALEIANFKNGALLERRMATHLVIGAPPAPLFQIPTEFTEVGLGEFMRRAEAQRGRTVSPEALAAVEARSR